MMSVRCVVMISVIEHCDHKGLEHCDDKVMENFDFIVMAIA